MLDASILLAAGGGIAILLILILRLKLPAFLALLLASLAIGLFAGLSPEKLFSVLQEGMGNTLGFVAIVVGLGALLGGLLEYAGGASALANSLLALFGEKKASWALLCTGFILSIPIFFDVAFIVLVPLIYSLQRKTGKSILTYGLPLLTGLAITHAFIPPTPGPVAVADILHVPLSWVIVFGTLVGIPTAILSGPVYSHYISKKIMIHAPVKQSSSTEDTPSTPLGLILFVIGLPLVLIVLKTIFESAGIIALMSQELALPILLLGHPFGALITANLVAWYGLGIRRGVSAKKLNQLANQSMGPAGLIILLTGAGGTFKQILITTNVGKMLAEVLLQQGIPLLLFAFLAAAIIRLLQGSATVAMITAAGLTAPLINPSFSDPQKALLVLAIAAGASILSHVNDTGFWLVSKYLGLNEKETFLSWSITTLLIAVIGFTTVCLLWTIV